MAAIVVIALRLILPLPVLRWPLAGGLFAMLLDAIDVVLVDAIAAALVSPVSSGRSTPRSTNGSTRTT